MQQIQSSWSLITQSWQPGSWRWWGMWAMHEQIRAFSEESQVQWKEKEMSKIWVGKGGVDLIRSLRGNWKWADYWLIVTPVLPAGAQRSELRVPTWLDSVEKAEPGCRLLTSWGILTWQNGYLEKLFQLPTTNPAMPLCERTALVWLLKSNGMKLLGWIWWVSKLQKLYKWKHFIVECLSMASLH